MKTTWLSGMRDFIAGSFAVTGSRPSVWYNQVFRLHDSSDSGADKIVRINGCDIFPDECWRLLGSCRRNTTRFQLAKIRREALELNIWCIRNELSRPRAKRSEGTSVDFFYRKAIQGAAEYGWVASGHENAKSLAIQTFGSFERLSQLLKVDPAIVSCLHIAAVNHMRSSIVCVCVSSNSPKGVGPQIASIWVNRIRFSAMWHLMGESNQLFHQPVSLIRCFWNRPLVHFQIRSQEDGIISTHFGYYSLYSTSLCLWCIEWNG